MSYQRGPDRSEVHLFPPCMDDYVAPNSPVRFIDCFVEKLDLATLGFTHGQAAATGRPPYHPADMVKLYVYGYLNRIRSSRRLEAEACRNLELIWLLRGIKPDFKTIADFRKDNCDVFKGVFKQFNLLCRKMGLFGAELVAIDGSKFKAVNSPRRHYTKEQLEELLKKIESRIDDYLNQLDQDDTEAEGTTGAPSQEDLQSKITELKERQRNYQELVSDLAATGENEVSLTDSDSRGMKKVVVGYNVQVAVDEKHHLIVASEVVPAANDRGQLSAMAVAAKEALGVEQLTVVADGGYHEAQQLENCEAAQITTYVSAPGTTSGQAPGGKSVFPKEAFQYEPASDSYRCPAGETLARGYSGDRDGKTCIYYYNKSACQTCAMRAQCTTSSHRKISRLSNQIVVERQAQRLKEQPQIMAKRKAIVEHVFGTIREWGHDRFLMRGLKKVRAEFTLSNLSYNLRRVLNVVGIEELLKTTMAMDLKAAL